MPTLEQLNVLLGGGFLVAFLKFLYSSVWVRFLALCQGIQAILRDDLLVTYEQWVKEGYAPLYAKQNFEKMYKAYHNLGKNGTMTEHYKVFMALPDFPPLEKELKRNGY